MTAPLPETAGAMEGTAAEKYAAQDNGPSPEIQAPMDASIPGEFDTSVAEAHAWQDQAKTMMDSAAGYGQDGYTITMPDLDGDADWPVNPSFPHQGP